MINEKLKRTIADDQKYVQFVTVSCHRRQNLQDLDHPKKVPLGVLNHQLEPTKAKRVSFVNIPDHTHAVIRLSKTEKLSRSIPDSKTPPKSDDDYSDGAESG